LSSASSRGEPTSGATTSNGRHQLEGTTADNGTFAVTMTGDNPISIKARGEVTSAQAEIMAALLKDGLLRKRDRKSILVEHEIRTDKAIFVLIFRPKNARNERMVFFQHGFSGKKQGVIRFGILLA
jgi:hypothetical protein